MREDPLADERRRMVEYLRRQGITDSRVLAAMERVPRHLFVPEPLRTWSYEDRPLPIGHEQTISQPYIVALMTEALGLTGQEKVLEIGTGSGYQTAILCELSREVFSIERIPELAEGARKRLEELGYGNVRIRVGDGTLGWPEEAPFDRIIVTGALPRIPEPLWEQLAEGGRLVAPIGPRGEQFLYVVSKERGKPRRRVLCPCSFVPIIGAKGWPGD
ncbi:MAG TPA: protein-L-isoaspartate(D-aspartate) O-methyltransferase [Candidatus Acetothermia bacterium]|nr:protein-L-isoaspartate(D-aspartate) O-methyltransferase [Candidatus Acetothermia bacterium]